MAPIAIGGTYVLPLIQLLYHCLRPRLRGRQRSRSRRPVAWLHQAKPICTEMFLNIKYFVLIEVRMMNIKIKSPHSFSGYNMLV